MAKKHKGKVVQMLSPENYIRTKARTLAVDKCLINENWEEYGIAHILITRKHSNNNVTIGLYLVDLMCLGVKDTFYRFNISRLELDEIKDTVFTDDLPMVEISYALAHNIIWAAVDFAEEYGFKPCKDFTSTTQFMLDEDTDDIPMMDIECGMDGKPTFTYCEEDDQAMVKRVIAHLEKNPGIGNFELICADDLDDDMYDDLLNEDDYYDEDEFGFEELSLEEKKEKLKDLLNTNDLEKIESGPSQLFQIIQSLSNELTDLELVDNYFESFSTTMLKIKPTEEITNQELGINDASAVIDEAIKDKFDELVDRIESFDKKAKKGVAAFKNQNPELPASYFLEVLYREYNEKKTKNLQDLALQFPNYPLIQILNLKNTVDLSNNEELDFSTLFDKIFQKSTTLTFREIFYFIRTYTMLIAGEMNLEKVHALNNLVHLYPFEESYTNELGAVISLFKLGIISKQLDL